MSRACIIYLICAILLAGCNLSSEPAKAPVRQNDSGVRLETVPLEPSPIANSAQQAPEPAVTETVPQQVLHRCDGAIDLDRPARQISADVNIDYQTKTAEVHQRITFHNREAEPLPELLLDVQANQWEGSFLLSHLAIYDQPLAYELAENRLQVILPEPLPPGCRLELTLAFRLQPAPIRDGLRSYRGFFGYSPRQLNLSHFLPTVAARLSGKWQLHQPAGIGEQVVYELADWQVKVTVNNAADSLQLAAPGEVNLLGEAQWEILLANSRDLAISLSEEFIVTEQAISGGLTLAVYTFADAQISTGGLRLDGAGHVLQEGTKAMDLFRRLFGSYAYDRFVIVQGDFPDGMEFTGLVFVSSAWFYHFDGGPNNYLTLISVHEIAHQWWYAQVGNDAALNPWLDEALATYSEYLFIEEFYPNDKNWWWTFRVANFFPQGKVDSPVYEFSSAREYINAIYLRGVQMLQNLREDIGDAEFFALLQAYGEAGDGHIADPALFWSQLSPEQQAQTSETRREFLRDPQVNALFDTDSDDNSTATANS